LVIPVVSVEERRLKALVFGLLCSESEETAVASRYRRRLTSGAEAQILLDG
jgi:hypothetical protein